MTDIIQHIRDFNIEAAVGRHFKTIAFAEDMPLLFARKLDSALAMLDFHAFCGCGIEGIGAGVAAFGKGQAVGVMGSVMGALGSLFGANSPIDQIIELAGNTTIDAERLKQLGMKLYNIHPGSNPDTEAGIKSLANAINLLHKETILRA